MVELETYQHSLWGESVRVVDGEYCFDYPLAAAFRRLEKIITSSLGENLGIQEGKGRLIGTGNQFFHTFFVLGEGVETQVIFLAKAETANRLPQTQLLLTQTEKEFHAWQTHVRTEELPDPEARNLSQEQQGDFDDYKVSVVMELVEAAADGDFDQELSVDCSNEIDPKDLECLLIEFPLTKARFEPERHRYS